MTDQHQEANLDGTFDAFRASGCTFDAVTLTHDMVVQEFRGLPLTQQMREAAKVLEDASMRTPDRPCDPGYWSWTPNQLRNAAINWEAKDRANAEREAMVEELARQMAYTFYVTGGSDPASPVATRVARILVDAGWKKVTDE